MGRPSGTKNIMRTPKEKEKLILEYINGNVGYRFVARKYDIADSIFRKWVKIYEEKGIDGLKSNTGKGHKVGGNTGISLRKPKTELERLELENLKLKLEVERLKKGYIVKGDGAKREYVTTLDVNTK